MPKLKTSLSLVGNYMCKNPPVVLFNVTELNNEKQSVKKYLINTPPDIQRNLQSQFVRINGSETVMFTNFSHETMSGMVNLILALYDYQKHRRVLQMKFYGTEKHWDYFQTAKFHLSQKSFGISYAAWCIPEYYRLGIIDDELYDEIVKSDKFSSFVCRSNWRLIKQPIHKVNDCRAYLNGRNDYYEDDYMIIKPFFEDNPSNVNMRQKGSKLNHISKQMKKQKIKEYTGSSTHFLCICKQQKQQQKQANEQSKNYGEKRTTSQPATLIITYKSVEQISKILNRTDVVEGFNKNMGLLDYLESNLKSSSQTDSPSHTHLTHIVHIISTPQLPLSQQFHSLFNTLDNLCNPSLTPATHLFYGYGLKSSTTNIHHLMNSYYKGVRFYSICSKLFRWLPNITYNHLSYWQKIFDRDFIDLCSLMQEKGANNNGSWMEVYKPMHSVSVNGHRSECSSAQNPLNDTNFYSVPASLLANLNYPLFSTASEYLFSQQLKSLYQKKSAFQKYNPAKSKGSRGVLISKIKQIKQFNPKVIFLGTNSKSPSELRNVSGILLQLPHNTSQTLCILDCGAGTYQQFVNQYEPQLLQSKLLNLKIIFMTHLHADHNLGIIDLIKKRNDLIKKKNLSLEDNKMFIILPLNTVGWYYGYCNSVENVNEGCDVLLTETLTGEKINIKDDFFESRMCQINMDRVRLSPGKLFAGKNHQNDTNYESSVYNQRYIKRFDNYEDYVKTLPDLDSNFKRDIISVHGQMQDGIKEAFDQMIKKMKLKQFMPSKVFHCPFSYGIVIEHNNGIKISYSGDCRPTPQFLEHAKHSTLLIHEATYQSNDQQKAQRRLHSTFHQAIQACLTSHSDHVCLTHFAPGPFDRDIAESLHRQLYKPQVYDAYRNKAIVACDYLGFNLSEAEDVVKASKIIAHIGRNSITEKNINPYTAKFAYQMKQKELELGKK